MKSYLFSSSQNFLLSFANFQSQLILAEYPKSGGSFFSNVLSDVYQSIYHFPRPINPLTFRPSLLSSSFSNVFDIDQSLLSFFYANKPIIKTHKCFMTSFKNVICLYRNPLSAISSYYDQLLSQGRVSSSISFSYFFFESPFGLKLYEKFYRSYLNTPRNSKIIFICYEQILLDLHSIVSDLALIFYAEKLPPIVLESLCARHSKQSYYKIQDIYYRYDCRPSFNSSFTSSHVPFVSSVSQPSYQKFFSESDYNAYDDWRFKSDVFNSISSRYWAK